MDNNNLVQETKTGMSASAPLTPTKAEEKNNPHANVIGAIESKVEEAPAPATVSAPPVTSPRPPPVKSEEELGTPISPLADLSKHLESSRKGFYSAFKAFNEWIGTYAQEITANYLNYLKVFAVALVVLALFSTVLHIISSAIIVPIFSRNADAGTCKALDGFISPEKTITLKALKEYLKNARERGLHEVSFGDIHTRAYPKASFSLASIGAVFTGAFWVSFVQTLERNFFNSFWYWITFVVAILTGIWKLLDTVQPILNLWTTLNVDVLINENKQREEREKRHDEKSFVQTCIVGWNIFERFIDAKTGKERCSLIMPTETSFDLREFLKDDPILFDRVNEVIEAAMPAVMNADPDCPDFIVVLPRSKDHMDFIRRIANRVSETVKSSMFPMFAHRRKALKKVENALFIVTCEKEPGVLARHTRVWLIYPSELQMLLKYSEQEILDKDGYFFVERDNWRIRVKNLYLWAKAEFDPETMKRKTTKYQSQTILLPLDVPVEEAKA